MAVWCKKYRNKKESEWKEIDVFFLFLVQNKTTKEKWNEILMLFYVEYIDGGE